MQIVSNDATNIYLTNNPTITFFRVINKKHTNFTIDLINTTYDQSEPIRKQSIPKQPTYMTEDDIG